MTLVGIRTNIVDLKNKKNNLTLLILFVFSVTCYGQYSISGYLDSKEENKTVYLSLLKYNEENLISNEQILLSTTTDRTGYFEIKGKLLSDKNKLYRIHSNFEEISSGFQLSDDDKKKNFHNFIFSNTDTIFFPNKNTVWFSYSKNSNLADNEWRKSLNHERNLQKEFAQTQNSEAIIQSRKDFINEFKLYCEDSLSHPLVKLLAFSQIKKYITDLKNDFKNDPNFYYSIENKLDQYYVGTSYYLQFQEEISKLSISIINQKYKFHKGINYLLGIILLSLFIALSFLLKKLKAKRKQEIVNEVSTLTNQEEKVAKLICNGMSNKEIASTLFISPSTVKTHIRNLYSKLEISNRQQLIDKLKNHP